MTGKSPSSSRLTAASDVVARSVSVVDIRLTKLQAELKSAQLTTPMKTVTALSDAVFERPVGRQRDKDLVIYQMTYDVSASDSDDKPIWGLSFTLSLSFRVLDDKLTDQQLQAFGAYGVVEIAHPYARELVHQMTARMRVPTFILEVLPWPRV